ncbi:hypothetical protein V6Z11_A04G121300 [Gossypium hirsutum]
MATTVAATSSFIGIRLFDVYSTSGRVVARFNFRGKKATKKVSKPNSDRPLWYPGVVAPDWFDGSLIGEYGFQTFGLGKPVEYFSFRECELIHGCWVMLAIVGALTIEWLTGVTWKDVGKFQRNAELDPEKKLYPDDKYFDPLGLASDPKKKATLQLVEIKHAATTCKCSLNNWATHLNDPFHTTFIDTFTS